MCSYKVCTDTGIHVCKHSSVLVVLLQLEAHVLMMSEYLAVCVTKFSIHFSFNLNDVNFSISCNYPKNWFWSILGALTNAKFRGFCFLFFLPPPPPQPPLFFSFFPTCYTLQVLSNLCGRFISRIALKFNNKENFKYSIPIPSSTKWKMCFLDKFLLSTTQIMDGCYMNMIRKTNASVCNIYIILIEIDNWHNSFLSSSVKMLA